MFASMSMSRHVAGQGVGPCRAAGTHAYACESRASYCRVLLQPPLHRFWDTGRSQPHPSVASRAYAHPVTLMNEVLLGVDGGDNRRIYS